MLYRVLLKKEETFWWDEDQLGDCIFSEANDEHARLFVGTVVQRMNRRYWRMREQRKVSVSSIHRLEESPATGLTEVEINLLTVIVPYQDFISIRRVLETFFPKNKQGKRVLSLMHMFANFNPIQRVVHT